MSEVTAVSEMSKMTMESEVSRVPGSVCDVCSMSVGVSGI